MNYNYCRHNCMHGIGNYLIDLFFVFFRSSYKRNPRQFRLVVSAAKINKPKNDHSPGSAMLNGSNAILHCHKTFSLRLQYYGIPHRRHDYIVYSIFFGAFSFDPRSKRDYRLNCYDYICVCVHS